MRAALLAAGISLALFSSEPTFASDTTIEVGVAPAATMPIYQAVADAYMQQNPSVQVKLRAAPSYPELTQQILRESMTGHVPDISFQAYSQIRVLVDQGLAVSLNHFIEASGGELTRSPALQSLGQVKGQTYAVPFWTSMPVVFFNLDLVKKAGSDPKKLPTTWDGILDLGRKMSDLGDNTSGFYYIYKNTDWPFQALVDSFGGRMMTPEEESTAFDQRAGELAFNLLERFGQAGMTDMTKDQARQAFVAGKLGILVDASSLLPGMEEKAKDRFEIGIGLHPVDSPDGRLPAGGNAMMLLSKDPDRQKAAWDFIKFASGPIGQAIMVKKTGALPLSLSDKEREELLGSYYRERPNQRALLEGRHLIINWFGFPGPNANKIVSLIENKSEAVATLKESPAEAMRTLAADVNALLPQ
ncbi:extracellular solute-binding protein [Sinorhizobium sp. 7-81]|uniref:extracellular solute-binding protein n=1 Tax=Sinorhizobium sp. 8-89 TaxID=3049089 RepID=UPI0024C4662F|nr:extracellular solute-binding protein [Sinorhizobium sp. 8-89]MDK1494589.1 extracellular solute-binding protein [Sinorhizobium sp. 8-89]